MTTLLTYPLSNEEMREYLYERPRRVQSARSQAPLFIGPAENGILHSLKDYHYLTAAQVQRLHGVSRKRAQLVLKRLRDAGYLQAVPLKRATLHGSVPLAYTLARGGLNALKEQGVTVWHRYHPREVDRLQYWHLNHKLTVSDLLIGLQLLAQTNPAIVLEALLHEVDIKRAFSVKVTITVRDSAGLRSVVKGYEPDAWVVLTAAGYRYGFAFEVDMATQEQKAWREKVRKIVAASNGPWQATFQTSLFSVPVVTVGGPKRVADLARWTAAELTALAEPAAAELFAFTTATPASESGAALLFAPRWRRGTSETLGSLIPTTLAQRR